MSLSKLRPAPGRGDVKGCRRARRPLAIAFRSGGIFLALLGATLVAGRSEIPHSEIGTVLERAEAALEAGQLADAESLYRALIESHPGFATAYEGLARSLAAQAREAEAVALLLEAGQGLVQAGSVETGTSYLRQAVELGPGSAAAHAALGHALLVSKEYGRAVEHLDQALSLGERGIAVRLFLGSALWESGEIERAESVFEEALALEQDSGPVRAALGGLLLWQGRYPEALVHLRAAAARAPESPQLQLDLARALEGAGETEAAIGAYRRVLEQAPEFRQAHYRLAMLLEAGGDRDAALTELERFQRLHDADQERTHQQGLVEARLSAGWHLLEQRKAEEAVRLFRQLPETPASLDGLASALTAAGDRAAAVRALEKAVMLAPERQDLRLRLGELRLEAERKP